MALKKFKPTTASLRHTVLVNTTGLSKKKPEKRLTKRRKKHAGRNSRGKITVRHQGGGVKRKYRIIDFKRDKFGISAVVESIEYDPNRSANIALLKYIDGERRYILAPEKLIIGQKIESGQKDVPVKIGNAMPLKEIQYGTIVHNIEMIPGNGGKIVRSAGMSAQIMGGDKKYIQLKMPSGEIRVVREECMATLGQVGNVDHGNIKLGKAGRSRRMGRRPSVRGVAMSSKHPHSGGQGKGGRVGTGGPAKDRWGNKIGVNKKE